MALRSATFGLFALTLACSARSRSSPFSSGSGSGSGDASSGAGGATSSGNGSGVGGGLAAVGSSGSGGSLPGDCNEAAKLVYVVGTGNELYSFAPQKLKFSKIGVINCVPQGANGSPFSMAVDRQSNAWVLYDDTQLFRVDTATAACVKTPYTPSQYPGFGKFGMGFASDDGAAGGETLYLGSYDGNGIARVTFPSLKVTFVGAYDKLNGAAELTGTGDGKLFGFFLSTPVTVAQIDKKNGHVLSQAPQPVTIGAGWAFAFWGGDFWLFTSPNGFSSQVDRYSPSKKTTTTVVPNVGFNIVGAGVSTCAPVDEPK